jgi:hypothetical protein
MASVPLPSPVVGSVVSTAPHSVPHSADTISGFDPTGVLDAHDISLSDYLNEPVHDILRRLGLSPAVGDQTPSPATDHAADGGAAPEAAAGPGSPLDPSQLIQPVTEALGTLGSGQFGNTDPTQIFQTITQTLESAGQSVQQALSSLPAGWQGDAANAAGAKTSAALANGVDVAQQADGLRESLTAAVASVSQAQARLIGIVNEFWAKIAAIGPSIIFPWGIAAAIAAANEAITQTADVMTETQSTLATQAGQVTAAGAPVTMTATPDVGGAMSALGGPVAATAAASPATGLQALSPLLQAASGLASPVAQGVGAVTQAAQSAAKAAPPPTEPKKDDPQAAGTGAPIRAAAGVGGSGAGSAATSRVSTPLTPLATDTPEATRGDAAVAAPPASAGGAPMPGGAPIGAAGRAGAGNRHYAPASFLHTSDQGDEIVGDLGSAAPAVVGASDAIHVPDVELRI